MRTFDCSCGNTLFFENNQCLACHRAVGWCPLCRDLAAVEGGAGGSLNCTKCQTELAPCANNQRYDICNRYVSLPNKASSLCMYCSLTHTIPHLGIEQNKARWYELERAKRRLLFTLDTLRLPYRKTTPKLVFDFKGDLPEDNILWKAMGKADRVCTGHREGTITINIAEADPEKRERMRVDLSESHRTLVGHFHHEIGHFYWEILVKGHWLAGFVEIFGDHQAPTYQQAMERYYADGPPANWCLSHVSAYATMHPWEDFAETFATYLDMAAVVDTAQGFAPEARTFDVAKCSFEAMFDRYRRLGIVLNEMNRTLGLIDYLPDPLNPGVRPKLEFVHDLIRAHQIWTDENAGPRPSKGQASVL